MGIVLLDLQDNLGQLNQHASSVILSMTLALILISMCHLYPLNISLMSMVSPPGAISWHQLGMTALFSCGKLAKSWTMVIVSVTAFSFAT
jgi:hypothetical protein